jgi:hypothetical protein
VVDLRIYRALLGLVAFAVIVFAFSLQSQPQAIGTPPAVAGSFSQAYGTMTNLARSFPDRAPGSAGDAELAAHIQQQLAGVHGFTVQTEDFTADTVDGQRVLENVVATSPGVNSGTIVVVSNRDASGAPAAAGLSGTAVMLELAQALSGETLNRTVMLVSTSGQIGSAGASELAASLAGGPQQVDAVIVLGDLAGSRVRSPVVVPWSDTDRLAPPILVNTLNALVSGQTGLPAAHTGLGGQVARLALPFATTEQAPFAAQGIPAALISLSGDRPAARDTAVAAGGSRIANLGTAVLQTVNALDSGPSVPAPSAYLVLSGKIVPMWAIRLLILALILPVAMTTLDALARTRRRGHLMTRWIGWVLVGALPFAIGLAVLLIARAARGLSVIPPGAVLGGSDAGRGVAITGADGALLGMILLAIVLAQLFLRPVCLRGLARMTAATGRPESPAADAAAVALSVVMCALTLMIWLINPFAALLLVPALHLWMWLAQPGVRSHRLGVAALLLVAIVPPLLIAAYYMVVYGLSPIALAWSIALMIGGAMPVAIAVCWAVSLGCLASALTIAWRAVRAAAAAPEPVVTVRGPTSYAGPGSLGGTESALRR